MLKPHRNTSTPLSCCSRCSETFKPESLFPATVTTFPRLHLRRKDFVKEKETSRAAAEATRSTTAGCRRLNVFSCFREALRQRDKGRDVGLKLFASHNEELKELTACEQNTCAPSQAVICVLVWKVLLLVARSGNSGFLFRPICLFKQSDTQRPDQLFISDRCFSVWFSNNEGTFSYCFEPLFTKKRNKVPMI